MKTFSRTLSLVASLVLVSGAVEAGGCRFEDVTNDKKLTSSYMAAMLKRQVRVVAERLQQQTGEQPEAMLIARSGESLGGLGFVKDDPSKSLQEYMDYLAELAINEGRKVTGAPTRTRPSGPQVPRKLVGDERLSFSHFGILIRKNPAHETAKDWSYVVHLLADCDEKSNRYGASSLWKQPIEEFFWDTKIANLKSARTRRALIVVPSVEIQHRLIELVNDRQMRNSLHESKYNVAAVPFRLRPYADRKKTAPEIYQLSDQNSNQWPLEMLAAATRPFGEVRSRMQAQDVLMATNYRPSIVDPTGLKESLACSLKKGPFGIWDASNLLNCRDQVYRRQGLMHIITVQSVVDYMLRNNFVDPVNAEKADEVEAFTKFDEGVFTLEVSKQKIEYYVEQGKTWDRIEALGGKTKVIAPMD